MAPFWLCLYSSQHEYSAGGQLLHANIWLQPGFQTEKRFCYHAIKCREITWFKKMNCKFALTFPCLMNTLMAFPLTCLLLVEHEAAVGVIHRHEGDLKMRSESIPWKGLDVLWVSSTASIPAHRALRLGTLIPTSNPGRRRSSGRRALSNCAPSCPCVIKYT